MRALLLAGAVASIACLAGAGCATSGDSDPTELAAGGPLGKADSAGVASLPVAGDYSATQAWVVTNQWEDTDTSDAQLAGMAWPANSGLNWDEKYAAWVGSFVEIPNLDNSFTTVTISTPFAKSVPGPKLDCADLAILLRFSFAAWYHLPIYLVGYDGSTPVYFGHFGVRTATGQWSQSSKFASFSDYSTETPAQYGATWPEDTTLRTRGISAGDDLPNLGPGAREGAFLDEIHLNKRAARLIMFTQAYLGSHNMVDSQNTYNLQATAIRTGDVLMFARAPTVDGHTTIVTRVDPVDAGHMKAQAIYGNDPPAQPQWQDPNDTLYLFTDQEGGGSDLNTAYGGTTPYSHLNGGLKRFRVAKAKNGKWVNTWMNADEASWINDTDYDAIAARVTQFATLLGDPDPNAERDQIVGVITAKRAYLEDHPSSCAARTDREAAFAQLYELMDQSFGMDRTAVDAQYRTTIDDYIFAPLDYSKSRTCCWDHTSHEMYDIIAAYEAAQAAGGCVDPTIFKMSNNGYDPFTTFAATQSDAAAWTSWSEDESCAADGMPNDAVLTDPALTPWCQLPQNAPAQ